MPIEFPIVDLLSKQSSYEWLLAHFHPVGLVCPRCGVGLNQGRLFRTRKTSQVADYRCGGCDQTYNVFRGTVFEGRWFTPEQAVLLVRGVVKGEEAQILASELGVCRQTAQAIRLIHWRPMNRPKLMRCIRMRGEVNPMLTRMTRRRANKQWGHGTYDNDRPPIVGTVGRDSGKVRLRMVKHTDGKTLCVHVAQFTQDDPQLYTDEWQGYNHVVRPHATACHAQKEWARDNDGDGIREVHINTVEGMWTLVRNFMRLFRRVHKKYLSSFLPSVSFTLISSASRPTSLLHWSLCTPR